MIRIHSSSIHPMLWILGRRHLFFFSFFFSFFMWSISFSRPALCVPKICGVNEKKKIIFLSLSFRRCK